MTISMDGVHLSTSDIVLTCFSSDGTWQILG